MPVPKWKRKDPSDIADYWFDWGSDAFSVSDRFLSEDMTIVAHSVTEYPIDCLITTSDGQVFEQTKLLPVEERAQT
jgi:hypothetical protein